MIVRDVQVLEESEIAQLIIVIFFSQTSLWLSGIGGT